MELLNGFPMMVSPAKNSELNVHKRNEMISTTVNHNYKDGQDIINLTGFRRMIAISS